MESTEKMQTSILAIVSIHRGMDAARRQTLFVCSNFRGVTAYQNT